MARRPSLNIEQPVGALMGGVLRLSWQTALLSEPRLAVFPAAGTHSAAKRRGRLQKVRKPSFFLTGRQFDTPA